MSLGMSLAPGTNPRKASSQRKASIFGEQSCFSRLLASTFATEGAAVQPWAPALLLIHASVPATSLLRGKSVGVLAPSSLGCSSGTLSAVPKGRTASERGGGQGPQAEPGGYPETCCLCPPSWAHGDPSNGAAPSPTPNTDDSFPSNSHRDHAYLPEGSGTMVLNQGGGNGDDFVPQRSCGPSPSYCWCSA